MGMNRPLVAIGGPTGSGKSNLAVHLALNFSGEIVNCDSLQVYRHFDIGTAKMPEEHRGGVRHHLIDAVEPHEGFTAGDFTVLGLAILSEITTRGNLPIVVGGTGFYLRALLDGFPIAPPSNELVRRRLLNREHRRPGSLHRLLTRFDPASSRRIHAHDVAKLIRALEIRIVSNRRASEQPASAPLAGYNVLKLGVFPDREQLYARLNARAEAMFKHGLLNEVEHLLAGGVSGHVKPFQSLGYKEALRVFDGSMTLETALDQMQRDTRRYAKRQFTWFRHERGILPLEGFGTDPEIQNEAERLVHALLKSELNSE